jgi:hypothetical protein
VTSRGGLSGLAIAEMATGLVLAWSGVENVPVTTILKSLAGGKLPPAGPPVPYATPAQDTDAEDESSLTAAEAEQLGSGLSSGSGSETANKALGRLMAGAYGWATGNNWAYLESGWEEESGWSATAQNGVWPGAYGIPQANPGTKLPKAGWPAAEGGSSSAVAQIAWGLAYIKSTYGAPVNVPGWSANGPSAGYTGY